MKKSCKECGLMKDLSDFYTHPEMRDNHLNICIDCKKSYAIRRRIENIDNIRAYERERAKTPNRIKHFTENARRWRSNNPEKYKAHIKLNNAVRNGTLERPSVCERCKQKNKNIHGHHTDYSKPLEVVWLCPLCHRKETLSSF